MTTEKEYKNLSKFLSFVLRHKPGTIGIELNENGWTDVDTLIEKCIEFGVFIDRDILNHIVSTNNKKRFSFNDSLNLIRANQGHSVGINLAYTSSNPPPILYHGTCVKFIDSILSSGLEKKDRHHVHLSSDLETAISVGSRHGKPFVFEILAEEMFENGFEFYLSDNQVWLTDHVPIRYLRKFTNNR
ncbi:MAG TPA: RNA 2'-phosphotransferase [Flavitalea sp.]|nr:RNA 2'-phosphotransferase [Flavitalea sp.]